MKRRLPQLNLIAAALLASGCATAPRDAAVPRDAGPTVVPHQSVRHSPGTAWAHYELGKRRLAEGEPQAALDAFDAALRLSPADADARNGRAGALARLGRVDEAIDELRALLAAAPRDAQLNNNLGYLLATRGRLDEAVEAMRTAIVADPASPQIRANWNRIAAQAADAQRAAVQTADAPAAPAVPAAAPNEPAPERTGSVSVVNIPARRPEAVPVARTPSTSGPPAFAPPVVNVAAPPVVAVAARPRSTGPAPGSTAVTPGGAIATPAAARDAAAPTSTARPAPAPQTAGPADPSPATVRPVRATAGMPPPDLVLEVANGAGVSGLARRTAAALRTSGLPVSRVTNWSDFRQQSTTLRYREGGLAGARALQARLGLPETALIRDDSLPRGTDAKLVLGRDAAGGTTLDRPLRAEHLETLRAEALALKRLLDAAPL